MQVSRFTAESTCSVTMVVRFQIAFLRSVQFGDVTTAASRFPYSSQHIESARVSCLIEKFKAIFDVLFVSAMNTSNQEVNSFIIAYLFQNTIISM